MGDEEDVDGIVRTVKEEQAEETATDTPMDAHTATAARDASALDMAQLPRELLYLLPPTVESIQARARGRGGVSVFGRAMDVDADVGGSVGGGGEGGVDGRREVSHFVVVVLCFVSMRVRLRR